MIKRINQKLARSYDNPQNTRAHFDWAHCPLPRQSFNPKPSRTHHLPRDSESDVLCLLASCVPKAQPLTCFECILSNKEGFKSDDWEDDNIPSCLWIFHFYSKTVKTDYVGQVSGFTGLNTRLKRIFSQLLFAIQLLPQCVSVLGPSLPNLWYLPEDQKENRASSWGAQSRIIFFSVRP